MLTVPAAINQSQRRHESVDLRPATHEEYLRAYEDLLVECSDDCDTSPIQDWHNFWGEDADTGSEWSVRLRNVAQESGA